MEHAARRPLSTLAALTTASALALTPLAVAPPELHSPSISAAHISDQTVQLTGAWSSLITGTVTAVIDLGSTYIGDDSTYPLPFPTIPFAPIATQLVLNQLIYLGQLLTGKGAEIPGEITNHVDNVVDTVSLISGVLPGIILSQLETPARAVNLAVESISSASNPLIGLLDAPAVFLDEVLNSQYGLFGNNGPIAVPIIIRNLLAKAIDPPLPGWLSNVLQPGKTQSAAVLTPKASSTTVTLKVPAASSARSGSTSSSTAGSSRKASAKASTSGTGTGHSKRS
ncbi:hypothetical protein [Mycolicibacterium sphagni]|uniref:PE-PPE domain-containing protein n=1 Tax=Mycolicibacterium sphagni TaxID=1786 RepID=A0A255DRJ0_9MYCO|nr:hypothetical protein [Mycolicibacterium sphagni]OYN79845.1 hypothetical protein CG716_10245 [Mycolicibacterium sphagni]